MTIQSLKCSSCIVQLVRHFKLFVDGFVFTEKRVVWFCGYTIRIRRSNCYIDKQVNEIDGCKGAAQTFSLLLDLLDYLC